MVVDTGEGYADDTVQSISHPRGRSQMRDNPPLPEVSTTLPEGDMEGWSLGVLYVLGSSAKHNKRR
ncbi:hypothetical protein SK128_005606, partial [Halocaridina rubra]